MKQLRCCRCWTLVPLGAHRRTCACGASYGKCVGSIIARVAGPCEVIEIYNGVLRNSTEGRWWVIDETLPDCHVERVEDGKALV